MSSKKFTPMEIDAIGEIMNISLGSSATAVSNMLDHRVDITTPRVTVVQAEEFTWEKLEPAIGVEIKYVTGLEGSNIMLLKEHDVKAITDILLGMETSDEEFELNDLTLSAVCEVMNQMMGAASTALSDFLGRMVNISTPQTFDANDLEAVKEHRLPVSEGPLVVIQFNLTIEGSISSEFMNVISVELAKELVAGFGLSESDEEEEPAPAPAPTTPQAGGTPPAPGKLSQEEIERLMGGEAGISSPVPEPAPAPAASGQKLSQEEIEAMMSGGVGGGAAPGPGPAPQQQPQPGQPGGAPPGYGAWPDGQGAAAQGAGYWGMPPQMQQMQQQMQMMMMQMQQMQQMQQDAPRAKKQERVIQTQSASMPRLEDGTQLNEEQSQNLDLIMSVPLEIAVEIGRTRKKVQEILSLSKGSLVVLNKLAGDQVDVYVNGKCIAHGDVVVVDDNFGIRISEIVRRPGIEDLKP